jgi:hypothetical protein
MASYNYITIIIIILIITACKSDKEQNPIVPVSIGKIQGFIVEAGTDLPLSEVKITTYPKTKEILSDSIGYFSMDNITPGDYMIYAHKPGFDYDSIFITVQADLTSEAEIRLINFSEYLDYYPLDIGNYWMYSSYYSAEVTADTIINCLTYQIIKEIYLSSGELKEVRYERIDTLSAMVYRYYPFFEKEFIIDSLAAKPGQSFTSNMFVFPNPMTQGFRICNSYCFEVSSRTLFGKIFEVKFLQHFCATDQPQYHMAKGIGITYISYWRSPTIPLKYARIRGLEYGEI